VDQSDDPHHSSLYNNSKPSMDDDFCSQKAELNPCAYIVYLLLVHGVDPMVKDGYGMTPFDYLDRWISYVCWEGGVVVSSV
jgi:hypothetical protein